MCFSPRGNLWILEQNKQKSLCQTSRHSLHSTNSPGDDQLLLVVCTVWLSVPLCVQHVHFNPPVYHKVLAVSSENPPSCSGWACPNSSELSYLAPGWEVMKYSIQLRVCGRNQPLITVPYWEQGGQRARGDGTREPLKRRRNSRETSDGGLGKNRSRSGLHDDPVFQYVWYLQSIVVTHQARRMSSN